MAKSKATVAPAPEYAVAGASFSDKMTALETELFKKKVRKIAARMVDEMPDEIRAWADAMRQETVVGCGCALVSLTVNAVVNEMLWSRRHNLDAEDEALINFLKLGASGVTLLLLVSCFRYRYFEACIFHYKRQLKTKQWYVGFGVEEEGQEAGEEVDSGSPGLVSMALLRDGLLVACQPVPFVNRVELRVRGGLGFQAMTAPNLSL